MRSIDFTFLDKDPKEIKNHFTNHYYRFQKPDDVISFFTALRRLRDTDSLRELFYVGYKKEENIFEGLEVVIQSILKNSKIVDTQGFNFLIGKPPMSSKSNSPMKRWNMFLRWMVRKDNIDFGLWQEVSTKDLIIPLDTHIFNVSKKIGLLNRKSYDLKSAILLTEKLKEFDSQDPVKYDFALYRIGQKKKIDKLLL